MDGSLPKKNVFSILNTNHILLCLFRLLYHYLSLYLFIMKKTPGIDRVYSKFYKSRWKKKNLDNLNLFYNKCTKIKFCDIILKENVRDTRSVYLRTIY